MARARNIKPGTFKNELLGTMDPLAVLLFISLWTLADREGRVEDRPLKIKAETFPYRESTDINGYLTLLERYGFITRYEVAETKVIQIIKFLEHQNPHGTEKDSTLPDRDGMLTVHERKGNCVTGKSSKIQYNNQYLNNNNVKETLPNVNLPNVNALIPSSLNPDSLNIESLKKDMSTSDKSEAVTGQSIVSEIFEHWKTVLDHPRANLDTKRTKVIKQALKSGYTRDDLKAAILGCSLTPHNIGMNDRRERYDSIELILRDAAHIDRFIKNSITPPAGNSHEANQHNPRTWQNGYDNRSRAKRVADTLDAIAVEAVTERGSFADRVD